MTTSYREAGLMLTIASYVPAGTPEHLSTQRVQVCILSTIFQVLYIHLRERASLVEALLKPIRANKGGLDEESVDHAAVGVSDLRAEGPRVAPPPRALHDLEPIRALPPRLDATQAPDSVVIGVVVDDVCPRVAHRVALRGLRERLRHVRLRDVVEAVHAECRTVRRFRALVVLGCVGGDDGVACEKNRIK